MLLTLLKMSPNKDLSYIWDQLFNKIITFATTKFNTISLNAQYFLVVSLTYNGESTRERHHILFENPPPPPSKKKKKLSCFQDSLLQNPICYPTPPSHGTRGGHPHCWIFLHKRIVLWSDWFLFFSL